LAILQNNEKKAWKNATLLLSSLSFAHKSKRKHTEDLLRVHKEVRCPIILKALLKFNMLILQSYFENPNLKE